jgi:5-methyltetrahydropteroyltriglutamate--homocysteine methyltransferase
MTIKTCITGFPRIGEKRELKKALENYWAKKSAIQDVHATAFELRKKNWLHQKNIGIDLISCNDFSLYDHMLDTIVMVNAIPERFRNIADENERYFAMARGTEGANAMEMTKWFNTNYHYIVPELDRNMDFRLNSSKITAEYKEARALGITPKINVIGPVTFLGLSKSFEGKDCLDYFRNIIPVYKKLVKELSSLDDTVFVQFDEPIFSKDPSARQLELLKTAYDALSSISTKTKIIVTTYFEHSIEASAVLATTPIWGIGLDFVHGPKNLETLGAVNGKKLIAGVVDGRNIWINVLRQTRALLDRIAAVVPRDDIIVSTSCSLLHVPYTVANEKNDGIINWLSFAYEKTLEVSLLSKLFHDEPITETENKLIKGNLKTLEEKKVSLKVNNPSVQQRINNISKRERNDAYQHRISVQKKAFRLPSLTTTTIGSFPQTGELRKIRSDYKNNIISLQDYENGIRNYIDECVAFQEEIGLDVLVHGEPERNDMVEYFGEMLLGFHFTANGWVQSYGSRCVKPPIIYGDVSRPGPMTVQWTTYAQGKTKKIMKGMLTGPVTILNWSFVRDDIAGSEVSRQIAVALSDEIEDLQSAGIKIIQVDEPAFKEGYPLRKKDVSLYEKWAVDNFKLSVSTARAETQIHTHMCYSDFNDIISTIEAMDADVITMENARSGNELLTVFKKTGYKNEIGPGVYDIHSARIPSVEEISQQITSLMKVFPTDQLWINPDCGLKTRKWEEVKPALTNMIEAVKKIRVAI